MPLSIGGVTRVYHDASQCEIVRHQVHHENLHVVSNSLRVLCKSLGEEQRDEFWQRTLIAIRRLTFAFCSVPLPFSMATEVIGIDWKKVGKQVRLCEHLYPSSHKLLAEIVQRIKQLSSEVDSPVIPVLTELSQESDSFSVVIRNLRLSQATAEYFSSKPELCNTKVISQRQLRGEHVCRVLATIGPCSWFEEYVFSAPRAETIHVVSFDWIRDVWKPRPVFLHDSSAAVENSHTHHIGAMARVRKDSPRTIGRNSDLQPSDLLPPLPVFSPGALRNTGSISPIAPESISARLCHLWGGRGVFVAREERASTLIIDTSQVGHVSVERKLTEELEPGHYLVLRTQGGGDFIAPLADRIMGEIAVIRRAQQNEWKQKLILAAEERFGLLSRRELSAELSVELSSRGLSKAAPVNILYWMSEKCISPRKFEDFRAIMTFSGMGRKTQEFWSSMREIYAAHKQAGFSIRRALLDRINNTSLEDLERTGEMVFDLGGDGGGSLSAFQIEAIQDDQLEVPVDRIGEILDMGE